jgi:hypothetical protein
MSTYEIDGAVRHAPVGEHAAAGELVLTGDPVYEPGMVQVTPAPTA